MRNRKKKPSKKEVRGVVDPVGRPRQGTLDMAYYEAMVMMDGGQSDQLKAEQLAELRRRHASKQLIEVVEGLSNPGEAERHCLSSRFCCHSAKD